MNEAIKIELRNLKFSDYEDLKQVMELVYKDLPDPYWTKKDVETLLDLFPGGQLCIEINGIVVAAALAIIVDYEKFGDNHTYNQITGNSTFSTHTPKGDVLYGIDVFVHPEYQGMRLARRLYEARKTLCEQLNLESIVLGGRIPGYKKYANEFTPKEYIEKVKMNQLYDPILTFQLHNDFHVRKVLKGYLKGDKHSKEYATLLEWNNIFYQSENKVQKSVVRLGLVQWQMRPFVDLESFFEQVDYFVDAVSDYQSDFVLFPEFIIAPLIGLFNELGESQSIRKLASFAEEVKDKFIELATTYNVNIIGGSMPYLIGEKLMN
ncbi:MAG: GNAT family N-acetyltransferase, partial [bacterium]